MNTRTKILLGLSVGLMITAVITFFAFFYQARLTILPTPSSAQVLLNSQLVLAGTPLKLAPGTYEIDVTAPNYIASHQTVTLSISQVLDLAASLRQIPSSHTLTGGVNFPVMSLDRKTLYFLGRNDSQFFQIDLTSEQAPQAITSERFREIVDVVWSPDRTLALLITKTGGTNLFDFERYDFVNQEERSLGSDFRSVTWHPTEHQFIGFSSTADGERSLVRYTIETGKLERLIDLRSSQFVDPELAWSPDGRSVLLVENGTWLFDVATRTLRQLGGGTGALKASWSPDTTRLLVESTTGLGIVDVNQPADLLRIPIRSNLTKSTWSADGSTLIIASPTDQDQDILQMVDPKSAAKTPYRYTSDVPINAENLFVDKENRQLWFTTNGTLATVLLELQESL